MLKLAYTDNDACSTCKVAVRVLSDMLCDPYVDDSVVSCMYLCKASFVKPKLVSFSAGQHACLICGQVASTHL